MSTDNEGKEFRFLYCMMISGIWSWFLVEPDSLGGYFRFFLSVGLISVVLLTIIHYLTK
jgi:hypothetical protein